MTVLQQNDDGSITIPLRTAVLFVALAVASGGGGSLLNDLARPARPDPFTGDDATKLASGIKEFVAAGFALNEREINVQLRELEQEIRADMPPGATRARIAAIETHLTQTDGYMPPTHKWQ